MKSCSATALLALSGALALLPPVSTARADENLFGAVRGSETLPAGHFDLYQSITLRDGKQFGSYHAWDFDTEVEYGFTDTFQMSVDVIQHAFDISGVEDLRNDTFYKFGGVEVAAKYRFNSVFKDGYGLTFRPEFGFLKYDDVGGIIQKELFIAPSLIFQKNFYDDTLIFVANAGFEFAFGKQPAEEYDKELSFQGGLGLTYRFAPNWFAGVETRVRSEYPRFVLSDHEHTAIFAGPSLHYAAQKWWATLQWGYQAYGSEVDSTESGKAWAEEARNEFRLKIGFNF